MKRWMKALVLFGVVFAIVVLAGSFGLMYYVEYQNQKAEAAAAKAGEEAAQQIAAQIEGGEPGSGPQAPEVQPDDADSRDDENKTGENEDGSDTAKESALPVIETDVPGAGDSEDAAGSGEAADGEETDDEADADAEEKPQHTGPVVLTFTGDICFHDGFANMGAYRQRGSDIGRCIDERLLTRMRDADICVVNNEFSYSDRGAPLPDKAFAFRSKPSNVSILTDMGVDVAGVANNHAFDWGQDAFLDTLDTIKGAGVLCIGGGRNLAEASAPAILEKGGMKIGILAATQIERNPSPDTRGATKDAPGVMRCFSETELADFLAAIGRAKEACDLVIVYVHWGTENTDELDFRQTEQATAFAEAGADLIVGAHPHCLQGLGRVGRVPVIYSLGNYWFNSKHVDTALLEVVLEDGAVKSVQMIPALQHDCRTDQLDGSEKTRIIGYLNSVSRDGACLDEEGYFIWDS